MSLLRVLALVAASVFVALPAFASDPSVYTGIVDGVAVGGYDPVAYFTAHRPVQGSSKFTYRYKGAEWRFSSEQNRALFVANPDHYAPQYGGFCAFAAARNAKASGDPQAWKIVDGKLYLNYSQDVKKQWEADTPSEIARANQNWPALSHRE